MAESDPAMTPGHPERRIAVGYTPRTARTGFATLLSLDERLASIVARTTEPTIGLIRLVWWRDALATLEKTVPAEPLLTAVSALVTSGVAGDELAAMVEGWAVLIDDPSLSDETVVIHADERGGRLFRLAGQILGASVDQMDRLSAAGAAWARVDLARHSSDVTRRAAILARARMPLEAVMIGGWSRRLRPLGQFVALALDDAQRGIEQWRSPASPMRLLRILRLHLTGR